VIVPKGVVHAYRNTGPGIGIVINCPNRLYLGPGKQEEVDEIRHEDDPHTIFRLDDAETMAG
jgi:dTDP-4-dehydrorhamnose 3,5-epimerase